MESCEALRKTVSKVMYQSNQVKSYLNCILLFVRYSLQVYFNVIFGSLSSYKYYLKKQI